MDWKEIAIFWHLFDRCGLRTLAQITGKPRTSIQRALVQSGHYNPHCNTNTNRIARRVAKPRVNKPKRAIQTPEEKRSIYEARRSSGIFKARSIHYYNNNKRAIYHRIKSDPNRNLRRICRRRIYNAIIRQTGNRKANRTTDLIGCSIPILRAHLEAQFKSGMSWDNYGEWHIDHKTPCAAFDLTDISQQRACFHYTNLQPLWAIENLMKSARLDIRHKSNPNECAASIPIRAITHNIIIYPKESFKTPVRMLVPKQAEVFAASSENSMSHKNA